jgi:hypothetical protein
VIFAEHHSGFKCRIDQNRKGRRFADDFKETIAPLACSSRSLTQIAAPEPSPQRRTTVQSQPWAGTERVLHPTRHANTGYSFRTRRRRPPGFAARAMVRGSSVTLLGLEARIPRSAFPATRPVRLYPCSPISRSAIAGGDATPSPEQTDPKTAQPSPNSQGRLTVPTLRLPTVTAKLNNINRQPGRCPAPDLIIVRLPDRRRFRRGMGNR